MSSPGSETLTPQSTGINEASTQPVVQQQPSKFCSFFGNCAEGLGRWLRCNGKKIMVALCVAFMLYMMLIFLAIEIEENQIMEESAAAAYLTAMYHWKCKGQGCGSKCPYSTVDDPRVFVSEQTEYITDVFNHMRSHLQQEVAENTNDSVANKDLAADLNGCINAESKATDNVFKLKLAANAIDASFSNCKVNQGTYKAQNHLAALTNAADVNKYAMVINSISRTNLVYSKLLDVENTAGTKSKIKKFDDKYPKWYNAMTAVKTIKSTCDATVAASSEFDQTQALVLNSVNNGLSLSDSTTNGLMDQVIKLASIKDTMSDLVENAVTQLNVINEFKKELDREKFEGFNNDLPGKLSSDAMNSLIADGNYSDAMIKTALEPSVVENHRKFAAERSTFDTAVNQLSVRDDPNDVVPWVAYSRPSYTKSDGVTSADQSITPLRSIPSDNINAIQAKPLKFSFSG